MSSPIVRRPLHAHLAVAALVIFFILVPRPVVGQVIQGRVVDAQSGAGVPLARVTVTGVSHRFNQRMFTNAEGRFSFPLRRGGSYRIQVTRAGYAQTRTPAYTVGADQTVSVDVRVSAVAHRLDAVTVTGRPRRLGVLGRFYETPDSVVGRVSVVAEPRRIRARGSFPTPHLCYHLSGNADRRASLITLTIQARGKSELCAAATGGFVYDVTVRRLPPGTYTLRVLHAFQDGVRAPAMVLDSTVTVQ